MRKPILGLEIDRVREMAKDASIVSEDPQEMIVIKKKTNTSRSWIVFDAAGQGTLLDMDKYAIMQRVQINARDLRILDPFLSYPSTIMGREKAIVLNLEHIKAIITAEEVLLQDPTNENVVPVVEELQRILLPKLSVVPQQQGDDTESDEEEEDESPFEFRVIEVALEAICSFLAARTTELEIAAYPTLEELTSKVSSRNLDKIRKLKSSMTRLTARVQQVKDEVEQLLGDDDNMADLYLSRKAGSTSPVSGLGIGSMISRVSIATSHFDDENDVEELEMLLEAYFVQIDSTLNKLTTMREFINDTEDYINFQLDNHRNKLIKLELGLNAATVCVSVYSLIAGIFGMNIPYSWNDNHGFVFKWVVLVATAISTIMFIMIIGYCRKRGLLGS